VRRMRYGFAPGAVQQMHCVFCVGAKSALKGDSVWPRGAHVRKMPPPRAGCHGATG
jgi:hypothetical protein